MLSSTSGLERALKVTLVSTDTSEELRVDLLWLFSTDGEAQLSEVDLFLLLTRKLCSFNILVGVVIVTASPSSKIAASCEADAANDSENRGLLFFADADNGVFGVAGAAASEPSGTEAALAGV